MQITQLPMVNMKKNREECVRYHGLSSTDGNSQRAMKYNSTMFLMISYLGP